MSSFLATALPPRVVYTSQQNGDWTNALTWDIGVPSNNQTGNNDDIIINHNVTLNSVLDVKNGTTITIKSGDTLIVNGNIIFNNGSNIVVENNAVLIINGNFINNNNSTDVNINGKVIINGDYNGGNGSILTGTGSMDITGTVTTNGTGSVFNSTTDCVIACGNSNDCNLDCAEPLPIQLISFDGKSYDNVIKLEWITGSESNNDYFTIEKYKYDFWTKIGIVKGSGNTSYATWYEFIDETPNNGANVYKLSQVDYDGKSEQFAPISVYHERSYKQKDMIVYPTPLKTNDNINIEFLGINSNEIFIVVMDVLGKIYIEKVVYNYYDGEVVVLNSTSLDSGVYLVIGSNKKELYEKIIIID